MYLLIHSVFLEILSCLVPSHQINMNRLKLTVAVVFIFPVLGCTGGADVSQTTDERDPSVARLWNEVLLEAIRNDFARPTVHARNLFHISAAMYDAWAVFDVTAGTFLLDKQVGGYGCPLDYVAYNRDFVAAREEAISFAAYRLITHRFALAPGFAAIQGDADALMLTLGYDATDTSTATRGGSAAAMGNYIASCYIGFGLQDGANETNDYANVSYSPVNPPVEPESPGNPDIVDLDRWQQISLTLFIDQAGNPVSTIPEFLSPEWGQVEPFALSTNDLSVFQRGGFDYYVYHDPGLPPLSAGTLADEYKWGFALVSAWSAHLDPADGVMVDISPASLGNIQSLPTDIADYRNFYDFLNGGDASTGHTSNPVTGAPYAPQIVPRGDYTRVLAEFWADGPDSETPPGHWFVILNSVQDHPMFQRRMEGTGEELGPLEWDVKAYFALGGAMHDSAIAAWGIKGWYDYLRPLSAIRAMADRGQSSDPLLPSYSVDGLPLVPGLIELLAPGDPLAGANGENVDKIKLYAWRGPDFINNPQTDQAGVGWILAENWWPYQRPTFVTPPFAGYVSGHSGGMSSFEIQANNFLVFEQGPSVDMTLQWATYRDASDQTSLSRLWGGIHPPADDIPGRIIGEQIGLDAFSFAREYFSGN
jgi:hypothetical protein